MKKIALGLSACLAVAVITMAQMPVSIAPGFSVSGTAAAPGVPVAGTPTSGLFNLGPGQVGIASSGVGYVGFFNDIVQLKSTTSLGWSSGVLNSATDTQITRVAAGEFGYTAVAFASLGTPASGTFAYCNDCTIANPCAGAGTGAFAKRLNGVWVCN